LETVHEEDLSIVSDFQEDNFDTTDGTNSITSTMEIGVTVDYSDSASTNSLTNQTIKNLDEQQERDLSSPSTSNSSSSFENIATQDADAKKDPEPSKQLNDNQLYEQLSQMKPLKPLNFKSSTSICLNQPDSLTQTSSLISPADVTACDEQQSNVKAASPLNREQSDSKMSSSSTSSLSSNSSSTNLSGNAHSENAESPANNCDEILPLIHAANDKNNIKNDVSSSSSTCSFSSGYNSDNNSNIRVQSQKSEILIDAKDIFANIDATPKSEQQANNSSSSTTMVVIPRRNSTVLTTSSVNSSQQQGSTASRRVSLSVTDL